MRVDAKGKYMQAKGDVCADAVPEDGPDDEAPDTEPAEDDNDCPVCLGSGGGLPPMTCSACGGSGQRVTMRRRMKRALRASELEDDDD